MVWRAGASFLILWRDTSISAGIVNFEVIFKPDCGSKVAEARRERQQRLCGPLGGYRR